MSGSGSPLRALAGLMAVTIIVLGVGTSPAAAPDLQSLSEGRAPGAGELPLLESRLQELAASLRPATVGLRAGGSAGSGVVISPDGYVLTAAHVSGRAGREFVVLFHDGTRARAKSLGANFGIDAGLLKLEGEGPWPHAEMARDVALKRGQWCIALGHPGGFQPDRPAPLRLGRVLADRRMGVETDCMLINGDSGGPLFDLEGRVIGIHSRIGSSFMANAHVPIKAFSDGWQRMVQGEVWGRGAPQVGGPFIGVRSQRFANRAVIRAVQPGSPADEAGIKADDVVLEFAGKEVGSFTDLARAVRSTKPGDEVKVVVERGEERLTLDLMVGRFGDDPGQARRGNEAGDDPGGSASPPATPDQADAEDDASGESSPEGAATEPGDAAESAAGAADDGAGAAPNEPDAGASENDGDGDGRSADRGTASEGTNGPAARSDEALRRARAEAIARRRRFAALQREALIERERQRELKPVEKNHASVLRAFSGIVESARQATVRVFAGERQVALGTIVDADGYILTKASELRPDITVKLAAGPRLPVEVIGVSDRFDLAMLKVPATELQPVQWAGQPASVGSILATPDGGPTPAAFGVVSVEPRELQGSGFLGVALMPDNSSQIRQVVPDSPAARADLQPGDRILAIDDMAAESRNAVVELLAPKRPGQTIELRFRRDDAVKEVDVRLGRRTGGTAGARTNILGGDISDRRSDFPMALQHDTTLRPEECGGPLVGLDGKAVGLNIARVGRVTSYALPAESLTPLIQQMINGEHRPADRFNRILESRSISDRIETKTLELYRAQAARERARQAELRAANELDQLRETQDALRSSD